MENTNTTIKQKQLQFTHKDIEFKVQTIYDTSNFSDGNLSFWKFRLIKVNNEFLQTPIEYKYIQNRRWLNQIPKFRKHSFYCSSSKKSIEDKTNIYQLIKQEAIYLYFNQRAIAKYKLQVDKFNSIIQKKYDKKLIPLKEQKKVLKQKLKSSIIDNKQYQKLYTPIRKKIDDVKFYIWKVQDKYKNRYFEGSRLKQIYREA